VLENIRRLNAFKKQYESDLPNLVMLWVVFGHNQHEIPKAKQMAKDLGMEFSPKMQWDSAYSPIRDPEQLKIELGWEHSTREAVFARTGKDYMSKVCHQLWQSPRINWDGSVLGCCWTQQGFGGSVFEDGLENAINNEKIVYARRMLAGEVPAREDIACSECPQYKKRLKAGRFVTREELEDSVPPGQKHSWS
jgi:MoaA/NifB/PqqE/SkfB family radical SAM enzyme